MEDKPSSMWLVGGSVLGSAALFGLGVVSGAFLMRVFRKGFLSGGNKDGGIDSFQRAARLAAIRAQGLGRNHKMIFVIRTDLGMGKGKIAAQCCHAAVMCYQKAMAMDIENLELWEASGQPKICLKAEGDEKSLLELQKKARDLNIIAAIVRDGGHTQVAPGTMTVLGIGPAPVSEIDKVTGHLKLL